MIIDIIIFAAIAFSIIKGFDSGFVPTLLAFIGYLVGGIGGLLVAKEVTSDWSDIWSVIGLYLLAIFVGGKVGQVIARSLGKGIRNIFGPLKAVDSLLGGLLGGMKAVILVVIALTMLDAVPNDRIAEELGKSEIQGLVNENLPSVVGDLFSHLKELSKS